ncbi:signal peptidase II [Candidatus Peregrinibacteria bacterium]|nr:signal peptidase II [Candidatus Peregrinibacteria bacterium]MBT4148043.1 signal peptidase II [Candidatus Peregrinibacteria bacterium]MBT4366053.1 signal peptidase II [Candidatus Peregrinibacteria bacterium]MBT4455556.1 signal peptidase II [Candidatus Peregrinibacteria bacterium]
MIAGIFDFYDLSVFEIDFDKKGDLVAGDMVIFKSEDGSEEIGRLVYLEEKARGKDLKKESQKIIRKATAHDIQKFEANQTRGDDAMVTCSELIKKHKLEMFPFYALYSLDGAKVNIIFTADDRVDFRELVKDLAKALQKQIHLKQIGPRDKARLVKGFGRCGRTFCCNGVLPSLISITMDMVRSQSLEGKGSAKLSGACGKLLCCLRYEVDAYNDLRAGLPSVGSFVKLKKAPYGNSDEGYVIALDILNRKVKLDLGNRDIATVGADEISKIIKKGINTSPRGAANNAN